MLSPQQLKAMKLSKDKQLKKPIEVTNPVKVQSYNDSLSLYNKGVYDKHVYDTIIKNKGLDPNELNTRKIDPSSSKDKIKPQTETYIQTIGSKSVRQKDGSYVSSNYYKGKDGSDVELYEINPDVSKLNRGYKEYKKPTTPVVLVDKKENKYPKIEGKSSVIQKKEPISPQKLKSISLAKGGDVIDTGVKNSAIEALPYLTIGRGSQAIKVPTATVIQHLQDPNSLVKTTRKDWDFNNLANLQAQLDYDDRIDGSGVQTLRYLADRVEPKGKKNLPLNPALLASLK